MMLVIFFHFVELLMHEKLFSSLLYKLQIYRVGQKVSCCTSGGDFFLMVGDGERSPQQGPGAEPLVRGAAV